MESFNGKQFHLTENVKIMNYEALKRSKTNITLSIIILSFTSKSKGPYYFHGTTVFLRRKITIVRF